MSSIYKTLHKLTCYVVTELDLTTEFNVTELREESKEHLKRVWYANRVQCTLTPPDDCFPVSLKDFHAIYDETDLCQAFLDFRLLVSNIILSFFASNPRKCFSMCVYCFNG